MSSKIDSREWEMLHEVAMGIIKSRKFIKEMSDKLGIEFVEQDDTEFESLVKSIEDKMDKR